MLGKDNTILVNLDSGKQVVFLTARKNATRMTLRIDSKTKKIHLSHPFGYPKRRIAEFVQAQMPWLERQLVKMPEHILFKPSLKIPFSGKVYTLVHVETSRGINMYEDMDSQSIVIECPAERFARSVEMFLKKEAKDTIAYIAYKKAEDIGKKISLLTVRDTKSRWGSCTSKGALSFSWRLIMAPPVVVDYLVAHEVAHLEHMNHSPAFWKVCSALSEDMPTAKKWLKENGSALHRFRTGVDIK